MGEDGKSADGSSRGYRTRACDVPPTEDAKPCCAEPKLVTQTLSDGRLFWTCVNCRRGGYESETTENFKIPQAGEDGADLSGYVEELQGKRWTAPDAMATEYEAQEFLHALVRLVKPQTVLETGTYRGHGTAAMARGLELNGSGLVFTCDTDDIRLYGAAGHLHAVGLSHRVIWLRKTGVQALGCIAAPIDFAFLDSGGDRLEEAQALLPKLAPGAVVVIHDSRRPNEQAAVAYLQNASAKTELLTFDTPRGLTVLRVWP